MFLVSFILPHIFYIQWIGGSTFVPNQAQFTVQVPTIPDILLHSEGTVHASSMFSLGGTESVEDWFRDNLVAPVDFELQQILANSNFDFGDLDTIPATAPAAFGEYVQIIKSKGFAVWNIQNAQHANCYLNLRDALGGRATLGARADYYICHPSATHADYSSNGKLLCVGLPVSFSKSNLLFGLFVHSTNTHTYTACSVHARN